MVAGVVEVTGWAIDLRPDRADRGLGRRRVHRLRRRLSDGDPRGPGRYPWLPSSLTEYAGYRYDLDTVSLNLTDGEHVLVIRTEDCWGGRTIIGERVFVVDNLSPAYVEDATASGDLSISMPTTPRGWRGVVSGRRAIRGRGDVCTRRCALLRSHCATWLVAAAPGARRRTIDECPRCELTQTTDCPSSRESLARPDPRAVTDARSPTECPQGAVSTSPIRVPRLPRRWGGAGSSARRNAQGLRHRHQRPSGGGSAALPQLAYHRADGFASCTYSSSDEIVEVSTFRASSEAPEGPDDWEEAHEEVPKEADEPSTSRRPSRGCFRHAGRGRLAPRLHRQRALLQHRGLLGHRLRRWPR